MLPKPYFDGIFKAFVIPPGFACSNSFLLTRELVACLKFYSYVERYIYEMTSWNCV